MNPNSLVTVVISLSLLAASSAREPLLNHNQPSWTQCGRVEPMIETQSDQLPASLPTMAGRWPWIVAINTFTTINHTATDPPAKRAERRCLGVLLSSRHSLASASCLTYRAPSRYQLHAGSVFFYETQQPHWLYTIGLSGVLVHPARRDWLYDLAIAQHDHILPLDWRLHPACTLRSQAGLVPSTELQMPRWVAAPSAAGRRVATVMPASHHQLLSAEVCAPYAPANLSCVLGSDMISRVYGDSPIDFSTSGPLFFRGQDMADVATPTFSYYVYGVPTQVVRYEGGLPKYVHYVNTLTEAVTSDWIEKIVAK